MSETPHPLPSWWLDACRLRVGLLKRPQPQVPHLTRPKYDAELDELTRFAKWLLWYEGGKKGPRPAFHTRVPEYAWALQKEYRMAHPKPGTLPPPPVVPPVKLDPPSWTLPSPLMLTASDPDAALDPATGKPRAGVATIGKIIVPGVCPLWRCDAVDGSGTGWLGQIEGIEQLDTALGFLKDKPAGDSRAIVGIGNVSAKRMIEIGVNCAFYELNAQAGWEPYGNVGKILFQAKQDGWPYHWPSYGVYDDIGLADYRDYPAEVTDDGGKTWRVGPPQGIAPYFAVFSASGMNDTASWQTLASL